MRKRLRQSLSRILTPQELETVCNSYDVIGDIAVIRATEIPRKRYQDVATAIMGIHRNVKVVLAQTSPVSGDFRVRGLEHVVGEHRTTTVHRESGCLFSVDTEKCYFSPRLSHERFRVAKQVKDGEVILNMFAGVGCFSLVIAKHSHPSRVYSVDSNPIAVEYMRENVRLNGAYGKVIPILADAGKIIDTRMQQKADRILMPLPAKALEYLPQAVKALKGRVGCVHIYEFEHAKSDEDPVKKAQLRVVEKLESLRIHFEIWSGRVVRSTGPRWYQVVLDVVVKR